MEDIDKGLFALDYKTAVDLSIELFAFSTADYPEAWWGPVAPRVIKAATAWALPTRRVLAGLKILGADVPRSGKFTMVGFDTLNDPNRPFLKCLNQCVNRFAHAQSCRITWETDGREVAAGSSMVGRCSILTMKTDERPEALIFLPALAHCFLTQVRRLVFSKAPWATIDASSLAIEMRDDKWVVLEMELNK